MLGSLTDGRWQSLKKRVITGVLLTAFALVLLYLGGAYFGVVAYVFLGIAIYEEFKALNTAGHRPISWPTWLAMIASIPLAMVFGAKVVIPVIMTACLLTIACIIFRSEPRLEDALMSLIPLLFVALPALCLISMATITPLSVQRVYLSLVLLVPICVDTMAFFVGNWVRGPKLCPAVSPNKTISGAIGGMVGAQLGVWLVACTAWCMCVPENIALMPNWWQFLLIGLIGGVTSQIGDLFASLVKRHCGIKDFSNLFPGHGGMLDRVDSIIFMSLTVYCFRLLIG